ncbi:putative LRR receptor-like serine/threonine-protein kinase [Camellia lanceoleosa]|uniref:LRR receptor-like serine/threonine-protein kinase n=1 Tax=Camellia lanceoleosa TaxID=1840588 RepID=A0ACC0IPY2_9ERIC|nr:putative LRR receptor-like serine/threonine-protein kinase [Camellia lanceoleosa]
MQDDVVIQFINPKVQASIAANTWVVSGSPQTKKLQDILPGIINQLGPDNLDNLRKLAEQLLRALSAAWHLHEINHEDKLVDANLSEFHEEEVKRVIGVALLCTQTSSMLRPSMSRVVGMLSGDFEVSAITTRPGYLTDWNFNDTTSFMSNDTPTVKKEHSHYSSSTRTSMVADPDRSPINDAKPMLQEIIGEGR